MTPLLEAAAELQAVCDAHRWQYGFIGGLAVMRWGEPRETVDANLTLLTGFSNERRDIDVLTKRFAARRDDAVDFALVEAVSRSSVFRFPPETRLRTCSGEDLIVFKAFADRPKDWLDVEGVIIRQSGALDWPYIQRHLAPLAELKEAPEIVGRLERLRATLET